MDHRVNSFFLSLALLVVARSWVPATVNPVRADLRLRSSSALTPNGPKGIAFPQQTPHSGRHFYPSHPAYSRRFIRRRKRCMEGWYYRLTLDDASFAIIISIEDPGVNSGLQLACIQVIGPNDEYIVQADKDDSKFWAWKHQQGLGCTFAPDNPDPSSSSSSSTALGAEEWKESVESGFQILPTSFLGKVEGSVGVFEDGDHPGSCEFDFDIKPICGWGQRQRTGGWLSNYNVFEPHWQVTLADAYATGSLTWNGRVYSFSNAKFYAEKNWGAALPPKWYWTQCNRFKNYENLSVTAGGGIRTIPFGRQESLGMIGVHYNNIFYEAVPWTGYMEWNVTAWGSWILRGNSTFGENPFAIEVAYSVVPSEKGLVFRAPTPEAGMVFFCRDTFAARTVLTLWGLEWDATDSCYKKLDPPIIDSAESYQGGAEIGGGPWWSTWKATSVLKQPIKMLLQVPSRIQRKAKL